jgi:twitching motility protein PilT
MSSNFKKDEDINLDFKKFLSALSSSKGQTSGAMPLPRPGAPAAPARPPVSRPPQADHQPPSAHDAAHKKSLFRRKGEEEEPQEKKKLSRPPQDAAGPPRGEVPPAPRRDVSPVKRQEVSASKGDEAKFLMTSREKAPEAPAADERAFIPRAEPAPQASSSQLVIKKPPRKPDGPPPAPAPPPPPVEKPRAEIRKPSPVVDDSVEKIALSHVSIRPQFTLEQLLETMIRENASDLHVATASIPSIRINGQIVRMELPDLDPEMTENLLMPILGEEQRAIFEEEGDVDFSFDYLDKGRFRINYYKQQWGVGASFRLIPNQIARLDQLGIPAVAKNLLRLKKGLIIVAGPSGSGKSTTIASMIEEVNSGRKLRIITIENPIEYVIKSKSSLISQREIGSSARNFTNALWAVLREDPDIIMLSELWDPEDMRQVLKISETGHLVISSIRTVDCSKAIERIVDAFPYDDQDQVKVILSESLAGIIAQRLIPRADGRGRIMASEVLLATHGLTTTIREGKFSQIPSIIQTGRDQGMQTMDQSLMELIEKKLITPQSAKALATDQRFFQRMGVRFDD